LASLSPTNRALAQFVGLPESRRYPIMFVLGFNLPGGKAIKHPDGKVERRPWVIGIGIGWSRSDFTRVIKSAENRGEGSGARKSS